MNKQSQIQYTTSPKTNSLRLYYFLLMASFESDSMRSNHLRNKDNVILELLYCSNDMFLKVSCFSCLPQTFARSDSIISYSNRTLQWRSGLIHQSLCVCSRIWHPTDHTGTYRKISNIRRIKFQNLNVSCLGLKLSLHIILKPSDKWRMKM